VRGTDALLAARLAAGDERALAEAFDQFGALVYGTAASLIGDSSAVQDVVRDVFVELWRHPGRFDPDAGSLRAYLLALTRNRMVATP
jgi:RNA polymerase sigma-70 factor, ECF subfamily